MRVEGKDARAWHRRRAAWCSARCSAWRMEGMPRVLKAAGLAAAMAGTLAACGVIYTSPFVGSGRPQSAFATTEFDVAEVLLTPETVKAANLAPYVPPRLPAAFSPEVIQSAKANLPAVVPEITTTQPRFGRTSLGPDRLPPITAPQPYRIGISDELLLSVNASTTALEDLPALISAQNSRQGYIVQDDGAIAIPDAGRVPVAGLTLEQAEAEIFQVLVSAGIDPSFTLEVIGFNSQRVSISGEVVQSQLLPIGLRPLYLHEAIQQAGGINAIDDAVVKVQLFRDGEVYQVGGERLLSDPEARRIVLRDGDSVYVASTIPGEIPATTDLELRRQQLRLQQEAQVESEFARDRDLFNQRLQLGAVLRPRAFLVGETNNQVIDLPFENQLTLAQVVASARINIQTADYGAIYVIRLPTDPALDGSVTAYRLDAENATNLALAVNFLIRPNDVIFIQEQPITSWNRALSQILPNIFQFIGPVSTL